MPQHQDSDPQRREEQRRGAALALFLKHPAEGASGYPDLVPDICRFICSSTNPFASATDDMVAREGSDAGFEHWEQATQWAENHWD